MSARSDDLNEPVVLRDKSPYQLVRAANLGRPAGIPAAEDFREIREEEIAGVPGADWLYRDYTETHLLYLRATHTLLYLMQVTVFVVAVALSKGQFLEVTENTITPFTLLPELVFALWIVLLLLEALFMFVIFRRTLTTVELLAKQMSWYYFPKYCFLGSYFYFQFTEGQNTAIINLALLVALYPLIHLVYHRVKYLDDGRFLVTWMELFGVQINISFYAAWIQSRLLHEVFVVIGYLNDEKSQIFGWTNSHWAVLANVLIFCIGVIYLSAYKDVFFNIVIIYSYVGIFLEQAHCPAENHGMCTSEVQKTVIILGVILSIFVLLVLALYNRQILYMRRN